MSSVALPAPTLTSRSIAGAVSGSAAPEKVIFNVAPSSMLKTSTARPLVIAVGVVRCITPPLRLIVELLLASSRCPPIVSRPSLSVTTAVAEPASSPLAAISIPPAIVTTEAALEIVSVPEALWKPALVSFWEGPSLTSPSTISVPAFAASPTLITPSAVVVPPLGSVPTLPSTSASPVLMNFAVPPRMFSVPVVVLFC